MRLGRSVMRRWPVVGLIAGLALGACDGGRMPEPSRALDAAHAVALTDSVRAFVGTVARGVSRDGPAAWRGYFEDSPAFFMASEGQLVFPTSDSATRAIRLLARRTARTDRCRGRGSGVRPV